MIQNKENVTAPANSREQQHRSAGQIQDPEEDDDDAGFGDMFPEPPRPPTPPPTSLSLPLPPFHPHHPSQLQLTLIPPSSTGSTLWGHLLWNAAISVSNYLCLEEVRTELGLGKGEGKGRGHRVVEFGAGGGMPGLVCGGLVAESTSGPQRRPTGKGKGKVVITDYPDPDLLSNLRRNVEVNGKLGLLDGQRAAPEGEEEGEEGWRKRVVVAGHIWGRDTGALLDLLDEDEEQEPSTIPFTQSTSASVPNSLRSDAGAQSTVSTSARNGYDILILSDLIFNHSQHNALLTSMDQLILRPAGSRPQNEFFKENYDPNEPEDTESLPKDYLPDPSPMIDSHHPLLPPPRHPRAFIFFSHHLPHHLHRDLLFFYRASLRGWLFRRVGKWKMGVMFEEDGRRLDGVVRSAASARRGDGVEPGEADLEEGMRGVREIVEGWEMWLP